MSVMWLVHVRDTAPAHSYEWHDSFICVSVAWLFHRCDTAHWDDMQVRVIDEIQGNPLPSSFEGKEYTDIQVSIGVCVCV